MNAQEVFPGVYRINGKFATKSLAPKVKVYGEDLRRVGKDEFRMWDPKRSKLGAALVKGLRNLPIKPAATVLYLGAANGTTSSHVADIVGEKGTVFAVEFSPHSMRDLLEVCEQRKNMLPILADARMPQAYADMVKKVDVVYADIADRDQTAALLRNAEAFGAKYVMIAVKARCIDSTANPRQIYQQERAKIEKVAKVTDFLILDPFETDHCFIVAEMKR